MNEMLSAGCGRAGIVAVEGSSTAHATADIIQRRQEGPT
jgi:hypothetical protein